MFSKEDSGCFKKFFRKTLLIKFIAFLALSCFLITACSKPLTEIRLGNSPFVYDLESEIGVLLIHGLSASPWEVKELADFLAEKNITTKAILLSGHGTDVRNLKDIKWQQWHEDAEKGLAELKTITKKVYVGGVSLGGSLALVLAADHDVQGVISISTPIYLRDENAQYADVLKYIREYHPANLTDEEKFYYYDRKPLASVSELMSFIEFSRAKLPEVKEPVLILQSENDKTVQPYSAAIIYERISSEDKEIKWFKGDAHVLVKADFKQDVFETIYDFILRTR